MAKYRNALPQTKGGVFLSDGGMETTLIFHEGLDLPEFASFVLLETPQGRGQLEAYYRRYLSIAQTRGAGFVLDTPTWRANPDWGRKLGYDQAGLDRINRQSVELLLDLREAYETPATSIVVSGAIGPRGDGYKAGRMSVSEAFDYHGPQVRSFAASKADMVAAYTITTVEEGAGVALAAKEAGIPVAISFTLETDGRLVSGASLKTAITEVDRITGRAPAYYMINCAHPSHFDKVLVGEEDWLGRIRGIKANSSTKSHAELDEATTLDAGDPQDLGHRYTLLRASLPALNILGGCCGTDHRHVEAIYEACFEPA